MKNPNGYGTVYKLSGNRRRPFIARVTVGFTEEGKQIFETIGYYKTRKEGNIALAEFNHNPYDIVARKLTFSDVYHQWSERRFPELSEKRVEQYKSIFRSLSSFHNLTFADIKLKQIQDYFDSRVDIASSSLEHYKMLFNQLYKYAMKHEITSKNHAQFIEIRKTGQVAPHTIFTHHEIDVLWAHCDEREVQIVLILIYTGMRISELLTMKREDVHLQERYMVGGNKTEAGKNRSIPINKRIFSFVEKFYNEGGEYLILKRNSGKTSAYSYHGFRYAIWKPLLKRFGWNHQIHDTRHTAVSLMDSAGLNKVVIKRIVGHKNEDVTEGYTHKELLELVTQIDRI